MNSSQLMAWLVCLALAFFAAGLAIHNSYRLALLKRQFTEVSAHATEQRRVLTDIRGLLERIERDMEGRGSSPQKPPPGAGTD